MTEQYLYPDMAGTIVTLTPEDAEAIKRATASISALQKLIKYRIGNYVITQRRDDSLVISDNIYRNIFDGTIVAEAHVIESNFSQPVQSVFVQLPDKTKMLIKQGDLQNYLNRFIYNTTEFTFNSETYEFN